ncbi:DUF1289 domain-containing protein [Vibrio sp.]|uniref:DUF1289 domain-containing protein n=1 Tax=Vibrio viridaestus TaxID=2487322 RepID=A0A3N9TLB0_9VIBR|nr:DUF1289 domain-containing protein [Vibrio viridaestus]MDC0610282.1 DUF1289 domain-containing protein [Vibrio sp.]RQW64385.1 DUF1289 domain-containing protein [Vibrio viridaestus]
MKIIREKNREKLIPNPCIRNCCLDDDDICLGCRRKLSEILEWHDASVERKQQILDDSRQRKSHHSNQ